MGVAQRPLSALQFVDAATAEACHQHAQQLADNGRSPEPCFTFGVISDIQHADIPDGASFHGVPRFYRAAKLALRHAVEAWRAYGTHSFAVHFGDIIDGYQPRERSAEVLDELLQEFDRLERPVYHMLGNHCLYNLPRSHLNQRLGIHGLNGASSTSYYSLTPANGWRVLVVDAYDVSIMGWPEGHPLHQQAKELLATHNPNDNKNSPDGLTGVARRWVQFGGGASAAQLDWVQAECAAAHDAGERVLVFSHLPFLPGSCPPACLLWNYEELLRVLRASGVVVATIAGHTHQNGYQLDDAGIHHIVLPAVVETPPGEDCYGHVAVYADRLELRGVGHMMGLNLPVLPIREQAQLPDMLKAATISTVAACSHQA